MFVCLYSQFPELIHSQKGWRCVVMFVMINIGFAFSFIALLLLAIYDRLFQYSQYSGSTHTYNYFFVL